MADGLTKALSDDDFKRFKAMVSVEDITERLNTQGTQPLSEEEKEALEDLIKGGEAGFPELGLWIASTTALANKPAVEGVCQLI